MDITLVNEFFLLHNNLDVPLKKLFKNIKNGVINSILPEIEKNRIIDLQNNVIQKYVA